MRDHSMGTDLPDADLKALEAERLAAIDTYHILDTVREPAFDDLTRIASEICETPVALISIVSDTRQFFMAESGFGRRETPMNESFCKIAIQSGDFMMVPDALLDERFARNPLTKGENPVRFYAGAVLRTPAGTPIGTLCVLDHRPRMLDEHQIRTLRLLARQAMTQIEMRRLIVERDETLAQMLEAVERRTLLTRELSHRMKNTLAMVQSIVTQSLRGTTSIEEGRDAISSRLAAMARAQDILTQASWAEASIRELVEGALAPHRSPDGNIVYDGPDLKANEQQGLGLTLAIHELATNALKYGALSAPGGRVDILWHGPAENFVFEWRESGGPPVVAPARRGFGSRLIERIVAPYFDGTAKLDFAASGVSFRLEGSVAIPTPKDGAVEDGATNRRFAR